MFPRECTSNRQERDIWRLTTKQSAMKRAAQFFLSVFIISSFSFCATSKAVVSHGADISKYSYVVFGNKSTGSKELADIMMAVENEIAATNLTVISAQEGLSKIALGYSVLSPNIHISTEKWNGGHTYITITFHDYQTNQSVVILKSSGIGLSISQDQNIAIKAIRKKLQAVFKKINRSGELNTQIYHTI